MGIIEDEILETISEGLERALQEHPDQTSGQLEDISEEAVQASLAALFEIMPDSLEKSSGQAIRSNRRRQLGFEKRCYKRWRAGFELYDLIVGVATEMGEKHAQAHFEAGEREVDYVFGALTHLHPRMLLVANEIGALLRTGYPDGALARWRTLHEITVVAMFISQSDQETAKRYLASFQFNSLRAANQYNKYADRANLTPFPAEEIEAMASACEEIKSDVGRNIGRDYDWAKENFEKNNPTLLDLEEATGLDHWRPRYRWASQHTHAGHRPPDKLLGMKEAKTPLNLVGSSNSGFVDPLSMSAISIAVCCAAFFGREPTVDSVVAMKSIEVLSQRLGQVALQLETNSFEHRQKKDDGVSLLRLTLSYLRKLRARFCR